MEAIMTEVTLKEKMVELFESSLRENFSNDRPAVRKARKEAISRFRELGFPSQKLEHWKGTNLSKPLMLEYVHHLQPIQQQIDAEKIFHCEVHDLDSYVVTLVNGWYTYKNTPLTTLPDGTVIGSFARAMEAYPEIFDKHFAAYADIRKDGFTALNTAFAQDGLFIYVPDGVEVEKPIQIINIIDLKENLFIQPRNLIVLGRSSRLQLIYCDHSLKHKASLINMVSEIMVGENASLGHYKVQNKDIDSTLINSTFYHQEQNSRLTSNTMTLNGGIVRNNIHAALAGKGCECDLYGLYLVDKEQHVDNHLFVDHQSPSCSSNQLYKGILDDQAEGVFTGHILVQKNAQKTNAYQNNRNILLTDKAVIQTKPHLEIYADDVKCSHGDTVGQLDPDAMFYLRSRGIGEDSARMLLMHAFVNEVIGKISIEPLRERIDELVSKRLRGELSICDQCVLDCSGKRKIAFDIDLSKI